MALPAREFFGNSVDRGRSREDDSPNAIPGGGTHHLDGAVLVDVVRQSGLAQRPRNGRNRGLVEDHVGTGHRRVQGVSVEDACLGHGDCIAEPSQPGVLAGREIVDDTDVVAPRQETIDQVVSDEARAAGDERPHAGSPMCPSGSQALGRVRASIAGLSLHLATTPGRRASGATAQSGPTARHRTRNNGEVSEDRLFDVAVVGGGIVGLATAFQLLRSQPALSVAVIEKEAELGVHQTGHNSGVLHAGLYYAPGSLKARLCREGKAELERFADEHGIPYRHCGKLVVALDETEIPRLMALKERAVANGVEGLEEVGPERIRELEPHVSGIRGLWSPRTGIIDFRRVALAYADEVRARGGTVVTGTRVLPSGIRQASES